MSFAATLKKHRLRHGILVEDLTATIQAQPGYVKDLELGTKLPTLDILCRLSMVLHVDIAVLVRAYYEDYRDKWTCGVPVEEADHIPSQKTLDAIAAGALKRLGVR